MKNYIIALLIGFCVFSCNDDFMERLPKDKETEKTFFNSYENCKTYAWQFYGWFAGYPLDQYSMDTYSDNGFNGSTTNQFGWDKVVEPTSTSIGKVLSNSKNWNYSNIRTINVMLDNIDNVPMSETDKAHWRSVCYFFKAQEYFRLMSLFGDVIWEEHALTDSDEDAKIVYGPTTPRTEIAQKILSMLQYAQANIKLNGDGANTVNQNVVNALMSRFGLFEGTWQKYHQVSGGNPSQYLQASYDASSALIEKIPSVHDNYNEVFNSEDLSSIPSVLLYKVYVATKGHTIMRTMGSSESWYEASSDLVQSYLCTDGKPIWTSTAYEGNKLTGDTTMAVEFRNRDRRLYYSICPPYRINTTFPQNKNMDSIWYYNSAPDIRFATSVLVPEDQEYVDLMRTLSTSRAVKTLPIMQWNSEVVREVPHFRNARYNMGQGYNVSVGGYFPYKIYTPDNQTSGGTNDAPIYRMGEVMANHAEAAWELGKFDQGVADKSINVLRRRANIPNLNIAEISADFDPKRDKGGHASSSSDPIVGPSDYEVDPVLWEIRRERRIELYCEGFRFDDLRRWGKGYYISKRQYGAYVKKSDYEDSRHIIYMSRTPGLDGINNFSMSITDQNKDGGRITIFEAPNPGWLNKYYLYPIPLDDLSLNPNLKQNPGYKSSK